MNPKNEVFNNVHENSLAEKQTMLLNMELMKKEQIILELQEKNKNQLVEKVMDQESFTRQCEIQTENSIAIAYRD